MHYRFEEDSQLAEGVIEVLVKSQHLDVEAESLPSYLERYSQKEPAILSLKTEKGLQMVQVEDIVYMEVSGDRLVLETLKGQFVIRERLYKFQERLANPDFVQVSKYAVLNIKHLESLEASFSGNMLAHLRGRRKCSVSRRYLKNLEKRLGL